MSTTGSDRPGALSPLKRALIAIEDLEAKLGALRRAQREPIAIVGGALTVNVALGPAAGA